MHSKLCKCRRPWLGIAALAFVFSAGAVAQERPASSSTHPGGLGPAVDVLSVEDLRAGQRGYGVSVFSGNTPQRFDVEILGVLRNFEAGADLILGRLSGQNLEKTGVIAGMSGSPVYIDGRLIGAVALGWAFSQDAIAGITPIAAMRGLGEPARLLAVGSGELAQASRPGGGSGMSLEGLHERLRELATGRIDPARWQEGWSPWRQGSAAGRPAIQWAARGLELSSRSWLERALESPVSVAGSNPLLGLEHLEPGGAVAAVLIDGDWKLAATGTVTERRGDEVLAFGHPFLGAGAVRLPMAPAEIVAVIGSSFNSFKLSNFGPPVGGFDVDRRAGIRGRVGLETPLVPVRVSLGQGQEFRLRVAPMPDLMPQLLALSLYGSLDAAGQVGGAQGLSLNLAFDLEGRRSLRLRQDFDGPSAALDAAVYVLGVTYVLTQSPLADVVLRGVDLEVVREVEPREATLLAAHASRGRVEPGSDVDIHFDLRSFRGDRFRHTVRVAIPAETPEGRYLLIAGSGPAIDTARLALEPALPQDFEQLVQFLEGLSARRDLVILGVVTGRGIVVGGEVLSRLPGSVRSLWSSPSPAALGLRYAIVDRRSEKLEVPFAGTARVELEIRRADRTRGGAEGF